MVVSWRVFLAALLAATAPPTPSATPRDVCLLQTAVQVQSAIRRDGDLSPSDQVQVAISSAADLQDLSPSDQDLSPSHQVQQLWDAGTWSGDLAGPRQWQVANFAGRGSALLQLADQPPSSWPTELDGKSVLLLGDSLDRNSFRYLCNTHEAATASYVTADLSTLAGASSYDFCRIGGITVGQFMNYGVFEPPYWIFAYKDKNVNGRYEMPDGLQSTSDDHILLDASQFKTVTRGGGDPTLVVVQSYLWDLASEWMYEGEMAQGYKPGDDFVARWAARVQHHMHIVRQAFPTSRLAWRTAPPVPEQNGRNPEVIHSMNDAARSFASEHDIQLVDYASMCETAGSPETSHLQEHIHPGEVASMAYMNVLLNVLAETE